MFFTNFIELDEGNVIFGDDNVACVKKKKLKKIKDCMCPNIPNFEEILYVDEFKTNLINMSQICDKKFNVQFSQNLCKVFDLDGNCVMIGLRTSNNSYVVSQESSLSSSLMYGSSKF